MTELHKGENVRQVVVQIPLVMVVDTSGDYTDDYTASAEDHGPPDYDGNYSSPRQRQGEGGDLQSKPFLFPKQDPMVEVDFSMD